MLTRDSGGAAPGAIMPEHYKHLGAQQAKVEYATAYSNGWEYDPEAMKGIIHELQGIRGEKLGEFQRLAADLTEIDPPGNEEVSIGYVMDANFSGQTYGGLLKSSVLFLESYIETLIKVDAAYREQDAAALQALRTVEV